MVKGIDVYQRFQGTIDWPAVARAGVVDVFVKLTNGPGPADVRGDAYVRAAHAARLRVGGYHYALGGSAAVQADAFAAELIRLHALDLAPTLDFEDASLPTGTAARRSWIVAFFERLHTRLPSLTKVLLYSSGSELETIGAGSIAVPGLTVLVWDGEYGPNDGSEHPIVHYTGRVAIHQYTSVGHVAGVRTTVDLDDIKTDITEEPVTDFSSPDTDPGPGHYGHDLLNVDQLANNTSFGFKALGAKLDAITRTLATLTTTVTAIQNDVAAIKATKPGSATTDGVTPPSDP
ncbi:MAG TPA: glycoside hydrolase family 25 protein [Pseudonocardiaceae bacterium]|jgi:lysozyme